MHGQPRRPAHDVPQGQVHTGDGLQSGASAAEVDGALDHLAPEHLHVEGVLPAQDGAQASRDGVAGRCVDDGLGHGRRGIDLAEADQALVGVHADDQGVLCPVGARVVHLRQPQGNSLNLGNLHRTSCLLSLLSMASG